jgi:hypothetical protein
MSYRCVATSVAGFIQQLAVGYIANGYYFYVAGVLPSHKSAERVDAKILAAYNIAISKWTRARLTRGALSTMAGAKSNFLSIGRDLSDEGPKLDSVRKSSIGRLAYPVERCGCSKQIHCSDR